MAKTKKNTFIFSKFNHNSVRIKFILRFSTSVLKIYSRLRIIFSSTVYNLSLPDFKSLFTHSCSIPTKPIRNIHCRTFEYVVMDFSKIFSYL